MMRHGEVPILFCPAPRPRCARRAAAAAAAAAVLILAMLALSVPAAAPIASAATPVSPARPGVPDWTLRTADGGEISLHGALAQGPVLLSFWALWCNPCLHELPHLDALARDTAGRLTVLAVNQDSPRSVARVRPYLQSKKLGLTVPLDTSGDVARRMQVGGILPFLVLYDANGNEMYRHIGYREGDEAMLRDKVMALLGEAATDSAEVK